MWNRKQPLKKPSPLAQAVAIGALLLLCGPLACALWTSPINGAGYLMGFGDQVRVHVTEDSRGANFSRNSEAGQGYYERGGAREQVRVYGVRAGQVVDARLPLIPVGIGTGPVVYADRSHAIRDLTLGLVGSVCLSIFPLIGGLALISVRRQRRAARDPG